MLNVVWHCVVSYLSAFLFFNISYLIMIFVFKRCLVLNCLISYLYLNNKVVSCFNYQNHVVSCRILFYFFIFMSFYLRPFISLFIVFLSIVFLFIGLKVHAIGFKIPAQLVPE